MAKVVNLQEYKQAKRPTTRGTNAAVDLAILSAAITVSAATLWLTILLSMRKGM